MYDPTIGRWISEDPIAFAAGDPNLYRYVKNDPMNGVDPSGEAIVKIWRNGFGPGSRQIRYVYVPNDYNGSTQRYIYDNVGLGWLVRPLDPAEYGLISQFLGNPQAERDIATFLTAVANTKVWPNFWPFLNSQCVRWTNSLMERVIDLPASQYPRQVVFRQFTLRYPPTGGPEHSIILVRRQDDTSGVAFGVDNGALAGSHIFDPLQVFENRSLPEETREDLRRAMIEFTGQNWPPPPEPILPPSGPQRHFENI